MAILGQARLGAMRLGAARLGYVSPSVLITIGGVRRESQVLLGGMMVTDVVDGGHAARSATMRVRGFTPSALQEVKIYLGAFDAASAIFGGVILSFDQIALEKQANVAYDLVCVDYTFQLNRRLVYKTYVNLSASAIAQDLIGTFTSGFTSVHVQAGLAIIPSITFDGLMVSQALDQLKARLSGARWFVSPTKDLYFFTADPRPALATITEATAMLEPPPVVTNEGSQVRTRVYVVGADSPTLSAIGVGETILPLQSVEMFDTIGGRAKVAGQVLTYAGKSAAAPSAPSGAPSVALVTGSGLSVGVYQYAYTDVTAAGETLPSPLATITTGVANAITRSGVTADASAFLGNGAYIYAYTFVNAAGETTTSPTQSFGALPGYREDLTGIAIGPTGTTARKLYRTVVNGSQLKLLATLADNVTTTFGDIYSDGFLGANAPTSGNPIAGQKVALSSIATGPGGTTARKIYRTVAGGSQLKLQQTIADNTTTVGVTDATADGSLGANAPSSDTSGLIGVTVSTTSGATSAGATSLVLASATGWPTTGGWGLLGNFAVRYTGVSANTLTGIPATGNGSIVAAVPSGTTVTCTAFITGVPASGTGSVVAAIPLGAPTALFVQRDDTAAQTALGLIELDDNGNPTDGIHEYEIPADSTLITSAAANAVGDAELAAFRSVEVKLKFDTRVRDIAAGMAIPVSFGAPTNVTGTFVAQRVTITGLGEMGGAPAGGRGPWTWPLKTVEASPTFLTLNDLLLRLLSK